MAVSDTTYQASGGLQAGSSGSLGRGTEANSTGGFVLFLILPWNSCQKAKRPFCSKNTQKMPCRRSTETVLSAEQALLLYTSPGLRQCFKTKNNVCLEKLQRKTDLLEHRFSSPGVILAENGNMGRGGIVFDRDLGGFYLNSCITNLCSGQSDTQ